MHMNSVCGCMQSGTQGVATEKVMLMAFDWVLRGLVFGFESLLHLMRMFH